jgi:hypothetical protein
MTAMDRSVANARLPSGMSHHFMPVQVHDINRYPNVMLQAVVTSI